jgi:hypothetical protein
MILDRVPKDVGDRATFLLKARNETCVPLCVDVDPSHFHVSSMPDGKGLTIVTHKPGSEGHYILKSQMVELFDQILEVS